MNAAGRCGPYRRCAREVDTGRHRARAGRQPAASSNPRTPQTTSGRTPDQRRGRGGFGRYDDAAGSGRNSGKGRNRPLRGGYWAGSAGPRSASVVARRLITTAEAAALKAKASSTVTGRFRRWEVRPSSE